jgi:hypothetical protein
LEERLKDCEIAQLAVKSQGIECPILEENDGFLSLLAPALFHFHFIEDCRKSMKMYGFALQKPNILCRLEG